jgi:DNA-binding beta-propeller fold protein YncE
VVATVTWAENSEIGNYPSDLAYDLAKGAIFFSRSSAVLFGSMNGTVWVLSDNTNAIVATVNLAHGSSSGIAYDSAKGEIFVANSDGTAFVISDSILPNVTPSPTTSALPSPSPTSTMSVSLTQKPRFLAKKY